VDGAQVFLGCAGIDIIFFPIRAAIVKTVPAAGRTKIVGDQPPGNQPRYFKLSQKRILLIFIHRRDAEDAEKAYDFGPILKTISVISVVKNDSPFPDIIHLI
jgi:hypothetical protein